MNGQKISELLNDVDDDLLADAMPPAWRAGNVKVPKQKSRFWPAFGRFMDSPWTAAALSVIVSVGVIIALVTVGQKVAGDPGGTPGVTPGGAPGGLPDGDTEYSVGGKPNGEPTDGDRADDTGAANDGDGNQGVALPDESPSTDVSGEIEAPPWLSAPVLVHANGFLFTDHLIGGIETGYMVWESGTTVIPGTDEAIDYEADGPGAANRLDELLADLVANSLTVSSAVNATEVSFTLQADIDGTVVQVDAYVPDADGGFSCMLTAKGNALALDPLREAGEAGYIIIVSVEKTTVGNTATARGLYEYPVYVTLQESTGDTPGDTSGAPVTFEDLHIPAYPRVSMTFDRNAIDKAIHGGVDIGNEDDLMGFIEDYCSTPYATPDVAAFINLLRMVPVPCYKDELPEQAIYFVGDRGLTFYHPLEGITYQYEMILDADEANELMTGTLTPEPEPYKVADHAAVVAVTNVSSDNAWLLWMDLGGVLAKTSVTCEDGGLAGQTPTQVFGNIYVVMPSITADSTEAEGGEPDTVEPVESETVDPELPLAPEFGLALSEDGTYYTLVDVNYTYNPAVSPINELTVPHEVDGIPVTKLADGVFAGVDVAYITVPGTVDEIGYAFAGCDELEGIYYEGRAAEWEAVSKPDDWYKNSPCMYYVDCIDDWIVLVQE